MKKIAWIVLVVVLLAACGGVEGSMTGASVPTLLVSDGTVQKSYTQADLERLPAGNAVFKDVAYKGVVLKDLLVDAGVGAPSIRAVKVVAGDGYSVNYDPAVFERGDVLVAYARVDGALGSEDGSFRMVIPGAEGKLNLRMLVEIRVVR